MKVKDDLSHSLVSSLIKYNPINGKLTWLHRDRSMFSSNRHFMVWNSRYAEKEINSISKDGYIQVSIFKKGMPGIGWRGFSFINNGLLINWIT